MRLTISAALAFLLLGVVPAGAQTTTGNLDGKVTDETGGALPGAVVTISSPSLMGTKSATTSANGAYRFPAIPPGLYAITYELPGFATLVRDSIRVELGTTTTIDVKLGLSSLQETVTVSGESPTVDVRNTAVGSTFGTQLLDNLPSSRQLLSVLAQTPGVQSTRVEVGASDLAAYTAPRTYGIAGRQQFNLDGVDITQGAGHVGTYPDYVSWEEVSISAGSHTAEARYPGMLTNTVIKSGGNAYHGELYGDYQNKNFESDNSSEELVQRGLRRGTALDYYWEGSTNLGGPIQRDRLWFYTGIRRQRYGNFPAGFYELNSAEPVSTYIQMDGFTFKGTYQLSQNNNLSAFVQRTVKHVPQNFAGAGIPPESTADWYVYGIPWKVQWTSVLSDRVFLDAGVYVHYQDWNVNPNSRLPRKYDLTTTWRDGQHSDPNSSNDFASYRRQGTRPQFRLKLHNQRERHEMKFGFEYVPYVETVDQKGSLGEAVQIYRGGTTPVGLPIDSPQALAGRFGTPAEVLLENTPVVIKDGLLTVSGFAHDTWNLSDRVTLSLGARVDHIAAYFPEQSSPQRLWAPAESFAEIRDVISWNSFAPRLGVVYALTADKKTAVKLNYGTYYESLEPRVFDLANPNGWKRSWYAWTDRNGNGQFVNADGSVDGDEINLTNPLRSTGGSNTRIDPEIKQPVMHEIALAFDRELFADFAVKFDYNYRTFKNNMGVVNELQTPDQFNIPVTVVDPGPDGRYGTADDGTVSAFNLNPALIGGQFVRSVLTSPAGFDQSYHNFTVSADRRLRDNWQMRASFTLTTIDEVARGGGIGYNLNFTYLNWPQNPNEALHSRTDWLTWNGRVLGSYNFPKFALQLSGVLRMQAGDQFARRFISRPGELNYGTQWFWAEPLNTNRLDNVYMLDLRAEKQFRLGQGARLAAMVDGFNMLNSAAVRLVNNTSGPSYLRVSSIVNARVFKIGARLTF